MGEPGERIDGGAGIWVRIETDAALRANGIGTSRRRRELSGQLRGIQGNLGSIGRFLHYAKIGVCRRDQGAALPVRRRSVPRHSAVMSVVEPPGLPIIRSTVI
jgi:hypothetical protein